MADSGIEVHMALLNRLDLPGTIPEAFAAVCQEASGRIAMEIKHVNGYRQYTYGEMVQQVRGLSTALIHMGLRPGDRVAIVAENRPEWAIAYLSIVTIGGTAVPLDFQMADEEIALLLAESESQVVFASARTWPLVTSLRSPAALVSLDPAPEPHAFVFDELVAQGLRHALGEVSIQPHDVASLLYTSGTTMKPKGVLLTHQNFISNAKALLGSGMGGPEDNFLVMLPLHHAFPFMVAFLVPLLLGARMTFLQSLKGPDIVQCLRETKVSMFVGVPQVFAMIRRAIFDDLGRRPALVRWVFAMLLALSGLVRRWTGWNLGRALFTPVHRRFGESLRFLFSGGARLDPQVARDLSRLGFTIREGYGLTETAPVVTFTSLARPKPASVGLPIVGVEVRIVSADEQGNGEVVVRGPNVMKGYDRDPEGTAAAIRDGWFHTGDLGYQDRDGYLFLTGRLKELIVTSGGKNISPGELEARYHQSPAIAELCIIGTERAGEGGETLHAVVVPDFTYLKEQKIQDGPSFIRDALTKISLTLQAYKRITAVSFLKEPLPRTRLGKIQRHRVAAMLESGQQPRRERPVLSEADQALWGTQVAGAVLSALRRLLPSRKEINLDDHLDMDLGLDSLQRVELLAALEGRVGFLPDSLAGEVITVRDMIEKLRTLELGALEGPEGDRPWREILAAAPLPARADGLLAFPSWLHRLVTKLSRAALVRILRIGCGLTVKGQEHLPDHGPFLLAANHVSYADAFVVLAAVPHQVFLRLFTLGWEGYFQGPFRARVARIGHVIPVGTKTPLVTVLRTSAAVLRQGNGLLVFPEGERSVDGRLHPFKKGIGVLACELGVPVIPVWIEGTYEAWPADARYPRFHRLGIRFGGSVSITSQMVAQWRRGGSDPHEAAARFIREAVEHLRPEAE